MRASGGGVGVRQAVFRGHAGGPLHVQRGSGHSRCPQGRLSFPGVNVVTAFTTKQDLIHRVRPLDHSSSSSGYTYR